MLDDRLLTAIASDYGTPAYVYDLADIRQAHGELVTALPGGSQLCYSVKANPLPAIVRELLSAGCWAEVCSLRELMIALGAGPATRVLVELPVREARPPRARYPRGSPPLLRRVDG